MKTISRRTLVCGSVAVLANVQAATNKLNVLVVGGHPGDPEYGCGGTIAKYVAAGHQVTILYLNRGGKGCTGKTSESCVAIRTAEAIEACRILGAQPRFADFADGQSVVDEVSYKAFGKIVDSISPNVILTHWPIDNHRDHRAAFMLTYDAWHSRKKLCSLYYYEVTDGEDTVMFGPDEYVDISGIGEVKRRACFAHASQAPDRFWAIQSEIGMFRGREAGCRLAEAFAFQQASPRGRLPV